MFRVSKLIYLNKLIDFKIYSFLVYQLYKPYNKLIQKIRANAKKKLAV